MTPKEMKKLSRTDLLRIVVRQQEQIERLEQENAKLQQQLTDRILVCERTGNIAQAALELSRIFELAQQAADQYLESVKETAPSPSTEESEDGQ